MKKRILAMLLLVAMIVTALPLMVLPSLAAEEEKTYEEGDYNALYVQDGLLLAFDVMTTNEHWGLPFKATFPTSPMETEAFDELSERYSTNHYHVLRAQPSAIGHLGYVGYEVLSAEYATPELAQAYIAGVSEADNKQYDYWIVGDNINDAFKTAASTYFTNEAAFWKAHTWKQGGTLKSTNPGGYSDDRKIRDIFLYRSAILDPVAGQGYVTVMNPVTTNNGINVGGIGTLENLSLQLVARPGTGIKSEFVLVGNVRPTVTVSGNDVTLGVKSGFTVDGTAESAPFDRTALQSFTFGIASNLTDGDTTYDRFTVKTPNKTLYSVKGSYTAKGTHMIGYNNSFGDADIYAIRYYNRDLSDAEILQNHFIDLMKWYRIDLTEYIDLTAPKKEALHKGFAEYSIGSVERDALLKAYYEAMGDYTEAASYLSAEMLAIAEELVLNVNALLATDAATRAYVESVVLADFKAGMPMETNVVQAVVDQAILYKDAFAFGGVQVRLHSSTKGDIPGVRAIFAVDKNRIASYAASGKDVAFGVEICDKYGNALAVLYFSADAAAECGYAGTNTLVSKQTSTPAIIQAVGENSLAFAYTVIFENKNGVNAQTAAYYNTEFGYRFFVEVDGLRNVQEDLVLGTFGETVSATEAYRHFYNVEGLTADATVNMVINEVGKAD